MNITNIISEIEKVDPEVYDRLDSRRSTLHSFTKIGGRIALTALPFMLGGMFKKAYGQTTTSIPDVLNFALTLEYLESEFYKKGVSTAGLIPDGTASGAFTTIRNHESAHVEFLKTTISSLGSTPVEMPTFDFTAGGTFADVFSNYNTFLAVAQTFEDTGVRAYKGQAGNLVSNNTVLTAALQIHSVEARHASKVRYLRRVQSGDNAIKPWITGNNSNIDSTAVQASYNGEELTLQSGVEIVNIGGQSISTDAATESFDEPLSMEAVLMIVDPFIV